ncbi:MAG: TVP38/TMEM64 family protein [Deltaproteobacteria bacterium]|nr:TVP38/TMEM64 family protein [Deltaproteobacteria bacterium]
MRRGLTRFIALTVFIIAALLVVRYTGLREFLDEARLRAWVEGYGAWGPAVYMLVYCVAPVLMVPGLPLTVIGGVLFGPLWGSIYVMVGATAGAGAAFLVARYLGRQWVSAMIKDTRLALLDAEVEKSGWKIVAITRLIPLFPFNLLNYAFGLTGIRFVPYIVASFFFMIPGAIAYVVFSSSLFDIAKGRVSPRLVAGVCLVVIVSLLPLAYKRLKRRLD